MTPKKGEMGKARGRDWTRAGQSAQAEAPNKSGRLEADHRRNLETLETSAGAEGEIDKATKRSAALTKAA
jgi:hypothetical protein